MQQLLALKGHKYGVRNFDIQDDMLVSIGDENDKGMIVWDLTQYKIVTANLMKNSLIQSVVFLE